MEQSKFKRIWKAVYRFAAVFFLFVLLSQLLCFFSSAYTQKNYANNISGFNPANVMCVFMMLLIFFSLVRSAVIFNESLRDEYFESKGKISSFKEKSAFFLWRGSFWAGAAAFALLYWLLPLKWCYMSLVALFTNGSPAIGDKLRIFAVLFPLLLALDILAHYSAMNFWRKDVFTEASKRYDYSEKSFIRIMLTIVLTYSLGGLVLINLVPFVAGALSGYASGFLGELLLLLIRVSAVFILLPIFIRYLRALVKRRSFIKRLKAICKEKGYALSEIKHPYLSVFFSFKGQSFDVRAGGKRYSCKFVSGKKQSVQMSLLPNGKGVFIRKFYFARVEMFKLVTRFEFGFNSPDRKILIINPVPKVVTKEEHGKARLVDNGELAGDYKVFAGTAFLNAMDRECLDR